MKSHKILLLILSFSLANFANTIKRHEKTKSVYKEYTVNEDATVYINNKYGNINITTWQKNKVEITVKITVKGNDLDKVADKLNAINIKFENSKDLVEARTEIQQSNSSWSWWNSGNSKVNYTIHYFIKIPKTNNVDLHNKYGDIVINELEGKSNILCNYGNVTAEKLLNKTNLIELNYCGDSEFDNINAANINADYSKITINKCEKIKTNIDYTSLKIGYVDDLSFNSDYGTINVTEANTASAYSDYTSMKFGTINKILNVNTNYGAVRINKLANNFEEVIIDGEYAGIKIGTPANNNFNFNINLSYAGFGYPEEKVTFNTSIIKNSSKKFSGYYGLSNNNSTLNIKSSYGSVSLKIND